MVHSGLETFVFLLEIERIDRGQAGGGASLPLVPVGIIMTIVHATTPRVPSNIL